MKRWDAVLRFRYGSWSRQWRRTQRYQALASRSRYIRNLRARIARIVQEAHGE